jgi:hypothetical protein
VSSLPKRNERKKSVDISWLYQAVKPREDSELKAAVSFTYIGDLASASLMTANEIVRRLWHPTLAGR